MGTCAQQSSRCVAPQTLGYAAAHTQTTRDDAISSSMDPYISAAVHVFVLPDFHTLFEWAKGLGSLCPGPELCA